MTMKRPSQLHDHPQGGFRLCTILLALALLGAACGGGDDGEPPPPPPFTPELPNVMRIANAEGSPGGAATVSFLLENVVALSALQFDIAFDPDVLTVTGAAAGPRAPGLEATLNTDNGFARVVLIDLDGNGRIAAGDGVVATVTVEVAAAAPVGPSALLVSNATAVNAAATTVPIGSSDGTFTVR